VRQPSQNHNQSRNPGDQPVASASRLSATAKQPRSASHEVFGNFLRTLEKLDREAGLRSRQSGGAR
jgi:hypothetical protein